MVTSGQASALTTIQRLNPIYVDVPQSSADLLRLRQQIALPALTDADPEVLVALLQPMFAALLGGAAPPG